jgi:hypothetical protein
MATSPSAYPLAAPVTEIERRLNWRLISIGVFACLMVVLAVIAAVSRFTSHPPLTGLPEDPAIATARVWVHGRTLPEHGALRWSSALLGDGATSGVFAPAERARARRAAAALEPAREKFRGDPRVVAALASLALVNADLRAAERGYRAALDRNPHYGEARLGLGVTLALRARLAPGVLKPRALELAAIAQFAAVPASDPLAPIALWNRAMLLDVVGRDDEARAIAREYRDYDPNGPWAAKLDGAGAGTALER